jgi:hypothetical protein
LVWIGRIGIILLPLASEHGGRPDADGAED